MAVFPVEHNTVVNDFLDRLIQGDTGMGSGTADLLRLAYEIVNGRVVDLDQAMSLLVTLLEYQTRVPDLVSAHQVPAWFGVWVTLVKPRSPGWFHGFRGEIFCTPSWGHAVAQAATVQLMRDVVSAKARAFDDTVAVPNQAERDG